MVLDCFTPKHPRQTVDISRELETRPLVKLRQINDAAKIHQHPQSTQGANKMIKSNLFTQNFFANQRGNESSYLGAPLQRQRPNSFKKDTNLYQDLKEQLTSKDELQKYQAMLETRKRLPTWSRREENVAAVRNKRIATISVDQRVAHERCEPCGGTSSSSGYQFGWNENYLAKEAPSSSAQ